MQRSRIARYVLLLTVVLFSLLALSAVAQANDSPTVDAPAEHAVFLPLLAVSQPDRTESKTLEEWMLYYIRWLVGEFGWTTEELPQQDGNVLMMPIPVGEQVSEDPVVVQGSCAVTIRPGTAFVLPVSTTIGESYVSGIPDDDPADYPLKELLGEDDKQTLVTLNGQTLIDSTEDNWEDSFVDPVYFDPPIVYAEPQPRGNPEPYADQTIWLQGLGFVHPPLRVVGTHTLKLKTYNLGPVIFDNTWTITVDPDATLDLACDAGE
jgi:hypothetical protein